MTNSDLRKTARRQDGVFWGLPLVLYRPRHPVLPHCRSGRPLVQVAQGDPEIFPSKRNKNGTHSWNASRVFLNS